MFGQLRKPADGEFGRRWRWSVLVQLFTAGIAREIALSELFRGFGREFGEKGRIWGIENREMFAIA